MKKQIFNQYAQKIADLFGIDKQELFVKSKKRDLVDARHLLYYLCFHRPMQLVSIQNFMEDLTSVLTLSKKPKTNQPLLQNTSERPTK